MKFKVLIQQDEDGRFNVSCPELEGCYSFGNTIDEAKKNIREAIELYLEDIPGTFRPQKGVILDSVKDMEKFCSGLGDENRLKILFILNELCLARLTDIQQILHIPQPTISRHLGLLKRMGLVDNFRIEKWNYYYYNEKQPVIVRDLIQSFISLEANRKLFRAEIGPLKGEMRSRPVKFTEVKV